MDEITIEKWVAYLLAFLGGLSALSPFFIGIIQNKMNKNRAEAAGAFDVSNAATNISGAWKILAEQLREENDRLRESRDANEVRFHDKILQFEERVSEYENEKRALRDLLDTLTDRVTLLLEENKSLLNIIIEGGLGIVDSEE